MKLGFLTGSINDIAKSARLGFDGIELKADAFGNAATGPLDAKRIEQASKLSRQYGVTITAIAYYDIAFNPPPANAVTTAYERVFDAAEALGVNVIASMIAMLLPIRSSATSTSHSSKR